MASSPVVDTTSGRVIGEIGPGGVFSYDGIPYGGTTAGENRFQSPIPPLAWSGVRQCLSPGPDCPQAELPKLGSGRLQSEDCLSLNVATPGLSGLRPTLVWLHGGGFRVGNGKLIGFGHLDVEAFLSERNCVWVGLNHRLGVLGYLQLGDEFGPDHADSGVVGMLDICAALEWIKANISNFGGDPDNVTLMGVSGGGTKIVHAMAMPSFKGLFHHGIVLNGHEMWKRNCLDASLRASRAVLAELQVKPGDLEKLRTYRAEELVHAAEAVRDVYSPDPAWGAEGWVFYDALSPSVGGAHLPCSPLEAIGQGAASEVDLMIVVDNWTHWSPSRRAVDTVLDPVRYGRMDEADLIGALTPSLGGYTADVIQEYRSLMPYASPSALLATIVLDRDWLVPALHLAEAKHAGGGKPPYVMFNVIHSAEDVGVYSLLFGDAGTEVFSRALVGQIGDAVAQFASHGEPDTNSLPRWYPYAPPTRDVLLLKDDPVIAADPFRARRSIWERTGLRPLPYVAAL